MKQFRILEPKLSKSHRARNEDIDRSFTFILSDVFVDLEGKRGVRGGIGTPYSSKNYSDRCRCVVVVSQPHTAYSKICGYRFLPHSPPPPPQFFSNLQFGIHLIQLIVMISENIKISSTPLHSVMDGEKNLKENLFIYF